MKLLLVQLKAELIYKKYRKEETEMEKKELVVKPDDVKIIDGKVVVTSEELVAAIQDYEVDMNGEEGDEALSINIFCHVGAFK